MRRARRHRSSPNPKKTSLSVKGIISVVEYACLAIVLVIPYLTVKRGLGWRSPKNTSAMNTDALGAGLSEGEVGEMKCPIKLSRLSCGVALTLACSCISENAHLCR